VSRRWQIDRRTFLRGVGVAVALPMLDAMAPSLCLAAEAAAAGPSATGPAGFPRRMAFVYVPNGVTMHDWRPTGTGTDFTLPRILQPLAPYRSDLCVLSGFAQHNGMALGDGAGDHARASASFLTGAHARKTSGADVRAGMSVDQLAANAIGDQTVLPSLELSCDAGRRLGSCDSGYSCAYTYNISWRSEAAPMNPEVDPRQVFERLFGDVSAGSDSRQARSRRATMQKSILDFVGDDARRLESHLGKNDRRKMDEYLTAVRQIERRVEMAAQTTPQLPDGAHAPEAFDGLEEHVKLMFDMLVLAFQTDSTRVATFIIGHEGSNRPYPFIGVNDGHHDVSHHFNDPVNIEKVTKIDCFHTQQFAYFLEKLKSIREGDGTLLDNSMIVYGSGISDGNRHNHDDLPILLAGRGGNTITPGRHITASKETPLNNLYLSMLDRVGVRTDRFGDSTGRFDVIS
jgi:hypothetical protein